jgi:dipeptidyl aminopeptidase/acylaminoacyl peptidase
MTDSKRPIQVDDLYRMVMVQDPQISPDGTWIAFVRLTRDPHANKTWQSIWLVRPDGSACRQFTSGQTNAFAPRWSPDGQRLAFVSDRAGKPQIYVMPVDGGEAQPITFMLNGVSDPAWSLDGQQIAFLSAMRLDELEAEDTQDALPPAAAWELDEAVKGVEEADAERFDPRVVDRVPFRAGTTFWDERFQQIYVVEAAPGARPRRLTSDARHYQPPRWAVDGTAIFTAASRQPDHDMPAMFNAVVRIDVANGEQTNLTGEGWSCHGVKPSPDGQWLAMTASPDTLPTNSQSRLAVMPAAGGAVQVLTTAFDRTVEAFSWSPDSQSLIFSARDAGRVPVYRVSPSGGMPSLAALPGATVTALDAGPDGLLVAAAFTEDGFYEIYSVSDIGVNRITDFNADLLAEVQVAPVEYLPYTAPDGIPLDGWVIKPPDYQPGQLYPLALNIHGGPSAMWGPSDPTMWLEWQHHAASGYVVFFCNPRGSTGYGEAYTLSNHGDWGDGPAGDVLAGVDVLVAQGLVDPARLAVTGGSYGGYLTAWIIGHDDRFAAAVAQRGVYHLHAFHGVTDIPLFMTSNMQAEPWEDPQLFWQQSPLAYADAIRTPLLLIHSEQDYRVPISEGEQLFTVLKRLGRTVQLVRYPREGHELSRSGEPRHIVDRLERIVAWWDRYCKPATDA